MYTILKKETSIFKSLSVFKIKISNTSIESERYYYYLSVTRQFYQITAFYKSVLGYLL